VPSASVDLPPYSCGSDVHEQLVADLVRAAHNVDLRQRRGVEEGLDELPDPAENHMGTLTM
jgi:hypothetical protein